MTKTQQLEEILQKNMPMVVEAGGIEGLIQSMREAYNLGVFHSAARMVATKQDKNGMVAKDEAKENIFKLRNEP